MRHDAKKLLHPGNEGDRQRFKQALQIALRYKRTLVDRIADQLIDSGESENPFVSGAEDIIDRSGHLIMSTEYVLSVLEWAYSQSLPRYADPPPPSERIRLKLIETTLDDGGECVNEWLSKQAAIDLRSVSLVGVGDRMSAAVAYTEIVPVDPGDQPRDAPE